MTITIPERALVVLVGASSAGKSTFARRHFGATEVISSDACRALVAGDENALHANAEAFALLHSLASTRLRQGQLAVIDATSVQPGSRRTLVALADANDVAAVAIVFDLPQPLLRERLRDRTDRTMGAHVLRRQTNQLRGSLAGLEDEGFERVHVLRTPAEAEAVVIERRAVPVDRREQRGPFDIIGDVHGCHDELEQLLADLGYVLTAGAHAHPQGRRAIFLGDLVNRGPASPAVLRTVMAMAGSASALCVPGNHDDLLVRALRGREVTISKGLAASLRQLEPEPAEFKRDVVAFVDGLAAHLVLDGGNLVVAHAGMIESLQGRDSPTARRFALLGETAGETDALRVRSRNRWAADYRGRAVVAYGHTPVAAATWVNRTICLDTGCVYGGRLSALRYPEMEVVSVAARRTYHEPPKRAISL